MNLKVKLNAKTFSEINFFMDGPVVEIYKAAKKKTAREIIPRPGRSARLMTPHRGKERNQALMRSTAMATPMPPPTQRVARPLPALARIISYSSVTSTRAPEAPMG